MHPEVPLKLPPSAQIILTIVITILISILAQNHLYAEETEIKNISSSSLTWGRKYFFDAPRYRDSTVQKQLDEAISQKLKTYGINLSEGNTNSKYVLNYTILLGNTASKSDIEDLYAEKPELREDSDSPSNIEHGKLLISIRDRDTYKPIWKNSIKGLAHLDMSKEKRQQLIINIVNQAFENFPIEANISP